ncbi:sulfotransferase family protein [Palleronia aestuarii]|uniref:Sulfotransferase family protein n=1 Tax=Palleronia aestuarii TaxID=568105 RepID=A0A2W7NK25_9RHOB|nr:sulfotransferase [Palleronia aestuarii]PZX17054.1 sulfotransferase family protein [Palleronia aestuarii]
MTRADRPFPWHRAFHPLCGADPVTLLELAARRGGPSFSAWPTFAVAVACSLVRAPFTLIEAGLDRFARAPSHPPVFVVGHPRSGTTHLHNVLAASGAFAVVPPVIATLPWERRTIGPIMRPFVNARLPRTRLIDGVAMHPDDPTEDEIGLANAGPLSYFHALYFPRRFAEDYRAGLLHRGTPRQRARRERAMAWYVRTMGRRRAAPLLLKNPAYTAHVDLLVRLFPGAKVIHIHRDPAEVFASARRALRIALDEMALQDPRGVDLDAAILATYPELMAGLRRSSAGLGPDTFREVAFADLVSDPARVIGRLWDDLGLPGGAEARTRAEAYCDAQAGYRSRAGVLEARELAALRRRWPEEFAVYGRLSAAGTG